MKALSYEEAAALAHAGATILHPETIEPAKRLRIPVVIRHTFRPAGEGTKIGFLPEACPNPVRSIACKLNVTVLEIRALPSEAISENSLREIQRFCSQDKTATLLGMSPDAIHLVLANNGARKETDFALDGCTQVHVRSNQVLITLVGHQLQRSDVLARLGPALAQKAGEVLPHTGEPHLVRIVIGQEHFAAFTEILQRTFFTNLDAAFFAPVDSPSQQEQMAPNSETFTFHGGRRLLPTNSSLRLA